MVRLKRIDIYCACPKCAVRYWQTTVRRELHRPAVWVIGEVERRFKRSEVGQ
jgi:hypothetical protein